MGEEEPGLAHTVCCWCRDHPEFPVFSTFAVACMRACVKKGCMATHMACDAANWLVDAQCIQHETLQTEWWTHNMWVWQAMRWVYDTWGELKCVWCTSWWVHGAWVGARAWDGIIISWLSECGHCRSEPECWKVHSNIRGAQRHRSKYLRKMSEVVQRQSIRPLWKHIEDVTIVIMPNECGQF